MKSWFDIVIRANLYKIVLVALFFATIAFAWVSFKASDVKIAALFGGAATGLFVAFLQYLIQLNEHRDIERFKRLGVREVLPHREGKLYYENLIKEARISICVLGNTANRFLDDFAHANREDSRALLDALARGVRVQILLPLPGYLSEADKARSAESLTRMRQIHNEFSEFQYKFYDHFPAHSLVVVDSECLVGPIFPHVHSKDSPAIHTHTGSPFVKHYIIHFKEEWSSAQNV
jgi:phosphatidylserine/phosphatidylglycerophosphate/cardiolipin synthase-like enzyme